MSACSLQTLLEGAGLDVLLTHVLPLLSLHDLGCLACSCRRLRAVAAEAPAAVWQAGAHRLHPHPAHPVHRATSCQAYLRQQHAVHAALGAGRSVRTTCSMPEPGVLSPDFDACAVLVKHGDSHSLVLREPASQRELKRISLPAQQYLMSSYGLKWGPATRCCAVLWGEAWVTQDAPRHKAGVCIVDTHTDAVHACNLGWQRAIPLYGGFLPSGYLLVQHTASAGPVWTACSATGARHRINVPQNCLSDYEQAFAVSPGGDHIALFSRSWLYGTHDSFTLWRLFAETSTTWLIDVDDRGLVRDIVWSSLPSHFLCVTTTHALIFDDLGSLLTSTPLSSGTTYDGWHHCNTLGTWVGDLVALMCRTRLFMFSVQDVGLVPRAEVDITGLPGKNFQWVMTNSPQISPDWQHVVVLAMQWSESRAHEHSVLLLRADGSLCMDYTCLRPGCPSSVAWSPSGAAVASDRSHVQHGFCVDLMSFV